MPIVNFPASYPVCFWIVALAWSVYQAYVGFQYGLYIIDSVQRKNKKDYNDNKEIPKHVRLIAYGIHHGAFYFLCSLSGFAAWYFAYCVSDGIYNWSGVASGTGAIIIALIVLSVLGVSGALPRILYMGNRPI